MSISLRDYHNLGKGDVVKLISLEELSTHTNYVREMGNYAGKPCTISYIEDTVFQIEGCRCYFYKEAIAEVLEHNAQYREMTHQVFNTLERGDLLLLESEYFIFNSWSGNRAMGHYGEQVVTFKQFCSSTSCYIVDDRGNFSWNENLIKYKVLKYTPPTEEEIKEALKITEYKHELSIKQNRLDNYESLGQLELVKMTDDVDRIMSYGNTERFAKFIAGKWLIVSNYSNRLYNELNPHIKNGLSFLKCNSWRVDGWSSLCLNRTKLGERFETRGIFSIDFENGTLENVVLNDPTRCIICGEKLETVEHTGRYCHSCLNENHGFAYRYGYHEYSDGYPTPPKVDTKKKLVFGCEIERDYISSANKTNDGFTTSLKKAMIDILKETQGEQLDSGTLKREQVFMSDGSLHNSGLEWITFPHTFEWYVKNKDKLDNAIKAIQNRGFKDSQLAGNHIHMNRDFFTNKQGKCTAKYCASKIAVLFNKYWEGFCAIAKRTRTNYTTKPRQEYTDDIFTIVEKTVSAQHEHGVAVNLQHSDTIEIRLWSAIKGADDLLFFLDVMQALGRYVKKCGLETIQKAKFTDFMKYFKLKSSIGVVKHRLRRKPLLRHLYEEVCALETKMKGEKK